jgi:uncharacterized membrane protein
MDKRFWEIDALRGVAILMMVLYHLLYDLAYFGGYDIDVYSGFWRYFARATASLFILLVGVSLTRSLRAATGAKHPESGRFRVSLGLFPKYLRRGLRIFGWGLVITLLTWLLTPEGTVVFGILHFIGLSVVLAYPFLQIRGWNLVLGLAAIVLGVYLQDVTVGFPWLLWLGLRPEHFATFDYFPVLPWFGLTLWGVFCGSWFYANDRRRLALPDLSACAPIRLLRFLGRHSLAVYMLHQPALIAALYLVGIIRVNLL